MKKSALIERGWGQGVMSLGSDPLICYNDQTDHVHACL